VGVGVGVGVGVSVSVSVSVSVGVFVILQATFWWWLPACNKKCHRMCFISTFYARGWPSIR
jgi:hypothetical protein